MEYLQAILRNFAAALEIPVFVILLILLIVVLWAIGATIVEYFTERRHFKVSLPSAINELENATYNNLNQVICASGMLWTQKASLLLVANNGGLPEDALFALAKGEVTKTEERFTRKVGRIDVLTKISPMIGLMCTLIPLGPGIVAMGEGNIALLSESIGVAFDGTVAGLTAAIVAMLVAYIRRRWYRSYTATEEAIMTTLLEKLVAERESGSVLTVGFTEQDLPPFRVEAKALVQNRKMQEHLSRQQAGNEGQNMQSQAPYRVQPPVPEDKTIDLSSYQSGADNQSRKQQ
ncbi:MAG: MotA/TolQ/ExbB proton channel family protein [Eggerthellaceae bacterium]|nr:MotA/TolQ/ExbB proton channel family protein [Eggerthellaceae bacterium]